VRIDCPSRHLLLVPQQIRLRDVESKLTSDRPLAPQHDHTTFTDPPFSEISQFPSASPRSPEASQFPSASPRSPEASQFPSDRLLLCGTKLSASGRSRSQQGSRRVGGARGEGRGNMERMRGRSGVMKNVDQCWGGDLAPMIHGIVGD
jgi:hypothetical protein